jgi:hypothetical protein
MEQWLIWVIFVSLVGTGYIVWDWVNDKRRKRHGDGDQ